jgi:RimJ/RimL family protein N-acetyltransferase
MATLKPVPYSPVHMEFCEFHPQFADAAERESPEMLARSKEAWTFLDENGAVIAIVGAMETHDRCAYIWTFMSKHAGPHMLAITRFISSWLPKLGCIRIEATVLKDFKAAHRWMRILGFKRETTRPMKRWDGVNDFHLYSMVAR